MTTANVPCRYYFHGNKKQDGYVAAYKTGDLDVVHNNLPDEYFACSKGSDCPYSHDFEDYLEVNGLKKCPMGDCYNLCKKTSKQCKECHLSMPSKTSWIPCRYYFHGNDETKGYIDYYTGGAADVVNNDVDSTEFFGCTQGAECNFSHDFEDYLEANGLKRCPSNECYNLCKNASKQCKTCHLEMMEKRREDEQDRQTFQSEYRRLRHQDDNRPLQQCQGWNCNEKTRHKYCKGCYEVINTYVIDRR